MIYAKDYKGADKKIDWDNRLITGIYIKGFPKSHRLCGYSNECVITRSWMGEEPSVYKRKYIDDLVPYADKGSRYRIDSRDYIARNLRNIDSDIKRLEKLSGLKSGDNNKDDLLLLLNFGARVFDNLIENKKLNIVFNDSHPNAVNLIDFWMDIESDFTCSFVLRYGYDGSSWEEYFPTKEKQIDIAFLKFFEWLYQITK